MAYVGFYLMCLFRSQNCEAHSNGTLEISVPTPSSTPSQTPTQTNGLHSPARSISLCSSYSSSFSDSDTDNDCVDDEPYGYDLNLDDIDATTTQQNVGKTSVWNASRALHTKTRTVNDRRFYFVIMDFQFVLQMALLF